MGSDGQVLEFGGNVNSVLGFGVHWPGSLRWMDLESSD